ncbi:MAG: PEP-CTERM sorting domain-containing protein [Janthinobacterium lividum]
MHLRFFEIAAVLFSFSAAAHASVLDFSGMPGDNTQTFSSYTEDGFVITNTSGQYLIGTYFGDPVPNLFSGSADNFFAAEATGTASVTVTRVGGGSFTFEGADLADDAMPGTYAYSGVMDGTSMFTQTGDIESTLFQEYKSNTPATAVTSLTITESGGDFNLDNIVVDAPATAVTPEPSSLFLMGTGILGVALTMRRRMT